MNKKETLNLAKNYLNRNEMIQDNNNVGIAKSRESQIKKYIANRNRQLGTFITDALSLKDVICDEETTCENPRFGAGAVEYYALDAVQLANYFAYRTLIKRGDVPKNNHASFLVLYLMEIVNGIYGNSYEDKRKKLNSVLSLYPKGAKYRSLIQEAYEILYLQNMNNLNLEDYKDSVNLPIFKDAKFDFPEKKVNRIPIHYIFSKIKIEKITACTTKDKFLLRECFEFVYEELNEKEGFEIGYYKTLDELFCFNYKISLDTPLTKLKAYYPVTCNVTFTNKKGDLETFVSGIHCTKKLYYDDIKTYRINKYIAFIINAIQHQCGGIPLPHYSKKAAYVASYFSSPEKLDVDLQRMADEAVGKWVRQNLYARKGYMMSLEALKSLKEQSNFKLDISDVSSVRKQSSEIQDKLIIEDGDVDPIIIPDKKSNPFVEKRADDSSSYFKNMKKADFISTPYTEKSDSEEKEVNEFKSIVESMSNWERKILRLLCDGKIAEAEDFADSKGDMLSLVVDRINTISDESLGDVIIIDNEIVEDYKDELIKTLNDNNI
jgi:hypothetical protein